MKRGAFRLEKILHLREQELSRRKSDLALRLRAQQRERDARDQWLGRMEREERRIGGGLRSGITAGRVQVSALAIDGARHEAQAAELYSPCCWM